VLVAMGLLDDRYQLRASIRLVGQFLVSLMMIFGAGLVIRSIGAPFFFGNIGTGALAIPFTVLVSVTVINAINMTDGMDGLAGGISVIALAPFLVLLLFAGRTLEAGLLAALLGAVIAFLLFNFPFGWNRSMRTFLGDAGSTFLGMVVVWVGISVTQGPDRLLSPVAALWFVASPVHDLLASTIRRARKRKPFWSPDLGHAHHILLKAGFTPRQTLLTILAVAALFCVIGLSGPLLGVSDGVLFTLWALAGIGHILVVQRAYLFSKILGILRAEL
jgi:UDP-GlcNAc:undecaprenyl-phosphate GlcNAc-1-phosphate transferase